MPALDLNGREINSYLDLLRPFRRFGASLPQNPFADRHDEAGFLGNRNELGRRNRATRPVSPAQKRLEAALAEGGQVGRGGRQADGAATSERGLCQGARLYRRKWPGARAQVNDGQHAASPDLLRDLIAR